MDDTESTTDTSMEKTQPLADQKSQTKYEEILLKEARENIEKGNYQAAASTFNDVLKRFQSTLNDGQKCSINSELGTLNYWMGHYDSAIRNCEQALAYGDNDYAYVILGKIAAARFRFAEARGFFTKISVENSARYLGLCLVCIKLRDSVGAQTFLNEAMVKNVSSDDPEFRVLRAYVTLLKGQSTMALLEAREMKTKCEKDPPLLILISEILMTAGNYGEAVALANHVSRRVPENDQVYAIKAFANFAEEDYNGALANAEEAVRLNPKNAYAKTVLMKLHVRDGRYSSAEKLGTEVLSDSPEYSLGHANLGDVYFIQGRYELARVHYDQTMQLMDSDTKGTRLRKARMKYIENKYSEAASLLENLGESFHTYYDDAMCDLLLCYDKMGDKEKKEDLIEKMQMRRSFYHRTEGLLKSFES